MMRALVLAAALALAASPALAADGDWVKDFETFCGGHPSDFDAAVRDSAVAGYSPRPGGPGGMTAYAKGEGEDERILIVSDAYSTQFSKNPKLLTRTCGVTRAGGSDPRSEVNRWLGLKPARQEAMDSYLFHVVDGRRVSLEGASDDVINAALAKDGYWFVGASTDARSSTVSMTHFKAGP